MLLGLQRRHMGSTILGTGRLPNSIRPFFDTQLCVIAVWKYR